MRDRALRAVESLLTLPRLTCSYFVAPCAEAELRESLVLTDKCDKTRIAVVPVTSDL